MRQMWIYILVFVLGTITGIAVQYATSGGRDRNQIASLEDQLKLKNDKLEKCTDVLINGLHATMPASAQPATGNPK
ncbi:MAG: hypothetical protein M3O09_07875 [Acidobacteriota bacterium]|jgi:hypothetical protein|nr:hypothetical protein [Acidobacteriota bacterium]